MRRMKVTLTVLICIAAIAAAVVVRPEMMHSQTRRQADNPYYADQLLIRFRPIATDALKAEIRNQLGARLKDRVRIDPISGDLELLSLPAGLTVDQAIAAISNHPAIFYAERNWIYKHQAVSNDPYYTNGSLWGMYGDTTSPANQYGSQAGEAWAQNLVGSDSVIVGVIDEGIDFNHPDLSANIWTNPYDPVDGVDNDGNGYADDVHGWDFFQNNNSIYDGSPDDSSTDAHGTHVSGTIGATGGNGSGVVGVNWNVTIISGKFLGPNGGDTANAIKSIDYFVDLKTRHGLNIVALNNSWGGGGYSQSLHDAIIRAAKAEILFCAAAGNGFLGFALNNDTNANYPSNYNTATGTSTESAASYDAVIAVASLTSAGAKSSFSNYGKTTVDLGAPGSGINSTTPNNTYSSYNGTSMATPHVTGAIALYETINPGATAAQVKQAILNSAINTPTSSLNNITVTNGRLNIGYLVGAPPPTPTPTPTPPPSPTPTPTPGPTPTAPSNLRTTLVANRRITIAWNDNSSNETRFEVERCTGASCTGFANIANPAANATSYTNTGLSRRTTYRYRVRACNVSGCSGYSNILNATTN